MIDMTDEEKIDSYILIHAVKGVTLLENSIYYSGDTVVEFNDDEKQELLVSANAIHTDILLNDAYGMLWANIDEIVSDAEAIMLASASGESKVKSHDEINVYKKALKYGVATINEDDAGYVLMKDLVGILYTAGNQASVNPDYDELVEETIPQLSGLDVPETGITKGYVNKVSNTLLGIDYIQAT